MRGKGSGKPRSGSLRKGAQNANFLITPSSDTGLSSDINDVTRLDENELKELAQRLLQTTTGLHKVPNLAVPTALDDEYSLRHYQQYGYSWLRHHLAANRGVILADDMGLGKSIQTIAATCGYFEANPNTPPALFLCPASLTTNWEREWAKFAPTIPVHVHAGPKRSDQIPLTAKVVIAPYSLVKPEEKAIIDGTWSLVALDEAQNLKNPGTALYTSVDSLNRQVSLALSGTPIENKVEDLWALFNLVSPNYLGSVEHFKRVLALPDGVDRLKRKIDNRILRRVKTDPSIAPDLPDKEEQIIPCGLSNIQQEQYEAIVAKAKADMADKTGFGRHGAILAMLGKLKQVCDLPKGVELRPGVSAKLDKSVQFLEPFAHAEKGRAIVFTQYVGVGNKLQEYYQKTFGCEVLFLHGGLSRQKRAELCDAFQKDDDDSRIIICSIKAAGTGLNLTKAQAVLHYDRWYNPAVEEQATDRAYRIGQLQDVLVGKIVCTGTLEERINQIIEDKKETADSVLKDEKSVEKALSSLDDEALWGLVNLNHTSRGKTSPEFGRRGKKRRNMEIHSLHSLKLKKK